MSLQNKHPIAKLRYKGLVSTFDLACSINCSDSFIRKIEAGAKVDIIWIEKIARFFNVNTYNLVAEVGNYVAE